MEMRKKVRTQTRSSFIYSSLICENKMEKKRFPFLFLIVIGDGRYG